MESSAPGRARLCYVKPNYLAAARAACESAAQVASFIY